MIGQLFSLLSAVTFAASTVYVRRAVYLLGSSTGVMYVSVLLGTILFALVMIISGTAVQLGSASALALLALAGAGIVHFVVGRWFNYTALRFIGSNRATPIMSTDVLVAVTLGVAFMGEPLTLGLALGAALIVTGVVLISLERGSSAGESGRGATRGALIRGIASALGAGICFGVSPVLVKIGLREGNSPFMATFVSYAAASIVVLAILAHPGQRKLVRGWEPRVIWPAILGGVFVALAQLSRYLALNYIAVSMVSPILSTTSLFVILFSFVINRKLELFTPKVIAGALSVVIGMLVVFTLA